MSARATVTQAPVQRTARENDARSLPDGTTIKADVCVIGAGPAGISAALVLARAGADVVLLEGGDRDPHAETRDFARGESVGNSYFPLHTTRGVGFGGTSALWFPGLFRSAPLTPLDFESRPGIPYSGWPINRATLDPYYEQAVRWCGLGRWDFTPETWQTAGRPALPFGEDAVATVVFQSAAIDTWRKRYAEVVSTPNLRLLLQARVVELATGGDGSRVSRVRVRTLSGVNFDVAPRTVVLASGGIENARLLLLSRDGAEKGLGNGNDLVGRFFQEHLSLRGGIFRFGDPSTGSRMGLYLMHEHESGTRVQGKLVVGEEVLRENQLLGAAFFVTYVSGLRAGRTSRSVAILQRALTWRPLPPKLALHGVRVLTHLPTALRATSEQLRRNAKPDTFQLLAEAEQSPNPDSRVTLSPRRRDPLGLPQARLDWRTTELDRQSIVESHRIIDRALRKSGLGRLEGMVGEEHPAKPFAGHWHHMGTTRMHDDPRQGVVDRNCRVHGMQNLYVAGSSVFPTSGYANPTLTIVALALRLAEHIENGMRLIG